MKKIIKKFVSILLVSSVLSISIANSAFASEKVAVGQTIQDIASTVQKIEADIKNMDYDELQKYLMDTTMMVYWGGLQDIWKWRL